MPLSLTLTEGVLPEGAEKQAIQQITDVFLKRHDLMPLWLIQVDTRSN